MSSDTSFLSGINLLVIETGGNCQSYTLKKEQGVFIGRSSNCGVQLPDSSIADIQCRLEFTLGTLRLTRWLSTEGVFVNQRELESEVEICLEDIITVGKYEIHLQAPNERKETDHPRSNKNRHPLAAEESTQHHTRNHKKQEANVLESVKLNPENHSDNETTHHQDMMQPISESMAKLESYLDEIKSEESTRLKQAPDSRPVKSIKPRQQNLKKTSNEQPVVADEDANLISDLRREISSLQGQVNTLVDRNHELQKQVKQLSENKTKDTFAYVKAPSQNSRSCKETLIKPNCGHEICDNPSSKARSATALATDHSCDRNQNDANKVTLSPDGQRSIPQTKSLTNKRLSDIAVKKQQADQKNNDRGELSPDRIQALRHQLRQQYETNRNSGSVLGRFTQLWK